MVKKSLIWLYSAATWLLWVGVILMACVVLGLRYYVLPNIQQYKPDIVAYASQAAGQKIDIGKIKAGWSGLHPHLDLYDLKLYDAQGRPALVLGHVETELSWLSLALGDLRLSSLVIHQPELTIRREADGAVYVAGIPMSGPSRPEFPNWLLRQSSIDVVDASVVWQDDLRGAPPLALHKLNLHVANPAWESFLGRHRFGLQAEPSTGGSQPIVLRGSVLGRDVGRMEQWRGTLYARVEDTELAAWRTWIDFPYDIRQGRGAVQAWMEFSAKRVDSLVADVVLRDVSARIGHQTPPTALQRLSGRLAWQRLPDGQELQAERLRLAAAGLRMHDGRLRVRKQGADGKETVSGEIRLDDIALEHLAGLANHLPLDPDLLQALSDTAPRGRVQDFSLKWSGTPAKVETYALDSRFTNLALNAYHGMPGFTGFSGSLQATQDGGKLTLNTGKSSLDLRDLLRQPIPFDKLSGQATWRMEQDNLAVKVTNLALTSPHLAGTLNAAYQRKGQGRGVLDLAGKFSQADGRYASFYYPVTLSPGTLHWLDTAIKGGQGSDVNVIVKGDLDEFPWENKKNGLFQVTAKISAGQLDYADHWPRIDGIKLDMLFRGNRMELNASEGRILGNSITRARVVIPALHGEHPVLEVDGEVTSPAGALLQFISASPVRDYTKHFTETMQASGAGKLTLALRIPLDTPQEGARVSGNYVVTDGTLTLDSDLPPLERLSGRLDFTESTLRAENVSAQLHGMPLLFGIRNDPQGRLLVTARGRADEAGIRRLVAHPVADRVHGATDWSGELALRDGKADVRLTSNLAGLSLALPPPLGKSAEQQVALEIAQTQHDAASQLITLRYGKALSAKLLRSSQGDEQQLERGEIRLGGTAEIPEQPGLHIAGRIDSLDWEQWESLTEDSSPQTDTLEVAGVNLAVGTLDAFGRRISDLTLAARRFSDGWVAGVASREITGDVTWLSAGNGKVVARLKALAVPPAQPAKLSNPDPATDRERSYPALDIIAETFEYKQKKLGHLELLASQQGSDWNISKFILTNPDSTLRLDGKWSNWRRSPATRLNLAWNIADLGKTMERYGYPDTIKGGEASLVGQLRWPGSPHNFEPGKLDGKLRLDTENGQFLKIKPGVGRLLGVLSLQSLPRRLLLDFSDVFSAGFSFDSISGDVDIASGVMKSNNFTMLGPSALVEISGETNLQKETQNLHIKVTPSISDSLSLAALAGGPAVGAAAFIAQKILKDPLNKLVSYEYDITGTWDDPQEMKSSKESPPRPAPFPSSMP